MTQEEFIEILDRERYSYKMEGDKIVITHKGYVDLDTIKTIPPGVTFKNDGFVNLRDLETLPPGVTFNNNGLVYLDNLEALPSDVEFKNGEDVYLKGLDWVNDNEGIKIEGVENKKLLNLMINKGLFI